MCHLENKVFESQPDLKTPLYVRYVDDICLITPKFDTLIQIKETFEANSVLKFTFETEINKKMPFLDTLIHRSGSNYRTSVYSKPTNFGDCLNYNSICP